MSNRGDLPKVNYLCANGHITRQRADKKAPKRCAFHGCGLKPIVDEPEFAQDISAMDQMALEHELAKQIVPVVKRKRKVIKAAAKKTARKVVKK